MVAKSEGDIPHTVDCSARYKRLLFGVNSASEQYQHEIQRALARIDKQKNISDDIIVHGNDQGKHDANLELVSKRLGERGLNPTQQSASSAWISYQSSR